MKAPFPPQLHYRADLDVFVVCWTTDSNLLELQAEHEAALAAGRAHGTSRWLLDIRFRPAPSAQATHWVAFDWLPRAAAALAPACPRFAYLMSAALGVAARTDPALLPSLHAVTRPGLPFELCLFNDEAAALRWLTA